MEPIEQMLDLLDNESDVCQAYLYQLRLLISPRLRNLRRFVTDLADFQ